MEISFKNKRALVTGGGREVTSALSASWEEIGYLMEEIARMKGREGSGPPELSLTRQNPTAEAAISRIGRGIVVELWRAGAEVVAVSTTRSYLETLQKEYPSIRIEALDLSDWDNTRKVIDSLGHFDCLVNNAALGLNEEFLTATPENFDKLMNINVKSVLNVSQVVAKKMVDSKSSGAIVNVSSQASKAALWGHITYAATKGALDAMTRVMAMELGPHNIRVNAVNPTVIMTDMGRQYWSEPKRAAEMLSKTPLGRFGEVSEVVDIVLFLLSDKASMINGVELPIDGGFIAC